ncbi:restriction endonuclease, partial [Achromobacter xylosoxidans]|uniref:restriction endonuclease n=1 Tax=Alcaligenes xylosoxydans xylosoxydans TaxID=85698 RepID=UPI001F0F03B7
RHRREQRRGGRVGRQPDRAAAQQHRQPHLRRFGGAVTQRGAREAIYIALGEVSDNALQYARAEGVSLMTAPELAKLLRDL